MKITAQEEYGLRCLLQLSQAADPAHGLSVKEIAGREGLSPAYVEKLLRLMSKSGLIHSVRGTKGGYLINRIPSEISMGDVVRALGSVPSASEICERHPGNQSACVHMDDCCIRSAWSTLSNSINEFLEKVKLSDLVGPEAKANQAIRQKVTTSFSV